MEVQEAEAHVRRLAQELFEQKALAEGAGKRAAALSKIIQGYVEMFPDLADLTFDLTIQLGEPIPVELPRGMEAVRLILQDQPDYNFYVSEVVAALKDRGWEPDSDNPASAVRAALERLVANPDSDVKKGHLPNGKVVYTYNPDLDHDLPERPNASNTGGYEYGEEPF